MKKLLIGAIVTAGIVAAAIYVKRKRSQSEYIEEDYDCDFDDYDVIDDEDVEEESIDEVVEADTADDSPKYDDKISQMIDILETADKLIKDEIFDMAMFSIRLGIETGVKCIISHGLGECSQSGLGSEIKICQEHGFLPDDLINDLQEAREKCNNIAHSIEETGYDDALFCYGVLNELIYKVRELA